MSLEMNAAAVLNLVAIAAFAGLVLAGALSDVRRLLIPNRICLAIVALYPLHAVFAAPPVAYGWAAAAALAVFAVGAALFAFKLVGGGDVKFLAAIALWAGPAHLLAMLLVMAVAGGVIAIAMIAARGELVAFGWRLFFAASGGSLRDAQSHAGAKVPYGAAIAVGGLYVVWRLIGG